MRSKSTITVVFSFKKRTASAKRPKSLRREMASKVAGLVDWTPISN